MNGEKTIKTACPRNCYDTCGVIVTVRGGVAVKVEGDPDHPVTRGHLCAKTKAILQRVYSPERIKHPLKRVGERGKGIFQRISWEEAFNLLVSKLKEIKETYGAEALIEYKYSGSHEILGKAVAQRFLNLFGATNLVGTLCNSNGAAGHEYTYGNRLCQDPLVWSENAECAVVWGRRIESTDVHMAPFLFRVKERGGKLIVIDPLVGSIGSKADLHLRPRPGSDAALALGMMSHIIREDLHDKEFIARYTYGFESLMMEVEKMPVSRAAQITEIPEKQIREAAELYARKRSMLIYGYAPQRYSNGFQTQRAISCLGAICGHIGKPGEHSEYNSGYCGPIMSGQGEVANPKEANIRRRRELVIGMANVGILEAQNPPIKAVICWRGGFINQQPDTNLSIKALMSLDFFVVFDQFLTDDTDYADLVLPACTFLEQYGFKNPIWHPYLQIQVPAIVPVYESMPDLDFWCELGRRMGFEKYFPAEWEARDWLRLLLNKEMNIEEMMSPQGPLRAPEQFYPRIPYQDLKFPTPTGKIELYSTRLEKFSKKKKDADAVPTFKEPEDSTFGTGGEYPLVLITPHPTYATSSQFQNLPWIKELDTAAIFIHPDDAALRGIRDGDFVRVFNQIGEARSCAKITKRVKPGMLSTWSGNWVKMGRAVNFVIKNTLGGPREVGNGIISAEEAPLNMLEDGCSPGYYGCYVELVRETKWKEV